MEQQKVGPIALATHVFDSVDFDVYFNHMYCALHWGQKYDLTIVGKKGLSAASARNAIIERCLENKCSYVVFLDGDHFVAVEFLDMLVESCTSLDAAMVSGIVCKRGEDFQQVGWEVHDDKEGNKQYYQVTLPLDGKCYQTSVCAFGCTIIDLKKLAKLKKPYFRDTCEKGAGGEIVNVRSDINLCLAFREIGETCWIDTRAIVGHLGIPQAVYPQSAPIFNKLKIIDKDAVKLREGQFGRYYVPGGGDD